MNDNRSDRVKRADELLERAEVSLKFGDYDATQALASLAVAYMIREGQEFSIDLEGGDDAL
jgi:hypothetical protein